MPYPKRPIDKKLCTADQAVALIQDAQTVASGGFIGSAHAEALTSALERRFEATGSPRNLTFVWAAGQGDGKTLGLNHLAHEGLITRAIGGHWGQAPKLGVMAMTGQIEAYNFPQGVMCQLFRDIAAGRPGCITHIGLDTFVDSIHRGGRINDRTPEGMVERVELGGKTWLWYKAFPINVGFIRGTAADPLGNIVMDDEAIVGEVLAIAQAVHNSGGIVIAQVRRILDSPAPPHTVRVPGILVDKVVIGQEHEHQQTFGSPFNADFYTPGALDQEPHASNPLKLDARRIIAARACDELRPGVIANLGIGMPEGIARIASERSLLSSFTLTVESGPIGGMPMGGFSFGAALNPHAIVDQPSQFDFYDGRGLDFAALGAAQIDEHGNVNVSQFGPKLAGLGGFVNITQTAKRLIFCGTFTTGGLSIAVENNQLRIVTEGTVRKLIRKVQQVSFSAAHSRKVGQDVLYITERAVFRLSDDVDGIELIEIAPGIDLERDVLGQMDFKPVIRNVRLMPAHVLLDAAHMADSSTSAKAGGS